MTAKCKKALEAARELPKADLQESLDDSWTEELERRFVEFMESGEPGFPWEAVKDLS